MMEKILVAGRYIFPLSFLMYVGLHLGKPDTGAAFVPDFLPYPYFWNYFTMVCILLFIISTVIGRYDRMAYFLMAVYVVLAGLLVHLPMAMGLNLTENMSAEALQQMQEMEVVNVFRNIMLTGALLGFGKYVARDSRGLVFAGESRA